MHEGVADIDLSLLMYEQDRYLAPFGYLGLSQKCVFRVIFVIVFRLSE